MDAFDGQVMASGGYGMSQFMKQDGQREQNRRQSTSPIRAIWQIVVGEQPAHDHDHDRQQGVDGDPETSDPDAGAHTTALSIVRRVPELASISTCTPSGSVRILAT